MASKQPFLTDGMIVDEILSLSSDEIRHMNKREISHALRTVALAANKRMNRLLKQSTKKRTGEYDKKTGRALFHWEEKKGAKYKIATDAINYITDDGRQSTKFGVGNKSRDEMIKEFGRVREFMNLETSTLKGAVNVRKAREKRILNQTREQYVNRELRKYKRDFQKRTKRLPSERQLKIMRNKLASDFESMSSLAWHYFRTFLESEGLPNNPYQKFDESARIIAMIGQRTAQGQSETEIHAAAHEYLTKRTEENTEKLTNDFSYKRSPERSEGESGDEGDEGLSMDY